MKNFQTKAKKYVDTLLRPLTTASQTLIYPRKSWGLGKTVLTSIIHAAGLPS